MGGHAFYKDAVVINMLSFNKILSIDHKKKIITVQSGVTWGQIIECINKYNLSVKVMQAYSAFTVGGSLSVNVHKSDIRLGPLIETVKSFRLLTANGEVLNVDRAENAELFSLVIGGYGLFGIILEADIELKDNCIMKKTEYIIDYSKYAEFFGEIRKKINIEFLFARLSFVKDRSMLRDIVATTYKKTNISAAKYFNLVINPNPLFKKIIFSLSRKYDWAKRLR